LYNLFVISLKDIQYFSLKPGPMIVIYDVDAVALFVVTTGSEGTSDNGGSRHDK
jgi:hypothetical protein